MKNIIRSLVLLFITISILNAKQLPSLESGVVAMINGIKVRDIDIERGVSKLFSAKYFHDNISNDKMEKFKADVLSELIEKELLFQYAKSIDIKPFRGNIPSKSLLSLSVFSPGNLYTYPNLLSGTLPT